MRDTVGFCADAYTGWHSSWLDALGLRWEQSDQCWRALERPPLIYLAGISLQPGLSAQALENVPGSVGDVWSELDMAPFGFRIWRTEPWFYRAPAPASGNPPSELELVRVTTPEEVLEFEAVSVRGFGSEDDVIEPGTYHPPEVLADEAMHMFIGRVEGRAVAAAMGYRLDDVVGVFGVTTVASGRRRGYGAALTRAAMLEETGLPAVLAPSDEGASMYRRLGFEPVGTLTIWSSAGL